ncbi:hypothetical protein L202_05088 [Cryptococcus amylolentus CBS 6039]|uniref:SAM domain-containing protein n=1 Tax=Cryptococcus amylolentus CBS 6039 TaxID=1295533 RepID=A0A1E3HNR2_9TREE|nr:hypothetical protein L202_05088 [Cryptococcus amylolentus CBS 6039]ODN77999.1 hypothetical protein L202_05088 [Cryptococcus amylolentus CBS 6039]
MASQTLRPHRSPSPSPSPEPPVNLHNPAKLTRQSLGPPTSGTQKGFGGLGVGSGQGSAAGGLASPSGASHPRHVSSSVAMGMGHRESLSPRPSIGAGRAVSAATGPRPSSEYLPPREMNRTPEAEQIDQWFKHLASWENTLEEMAAASTDQNFTEELGAIEQWFRVLSEAERTAALYSLLQQATPVQIRFFISVLHHMSQSDPMTALLSPAPPATAGIASQMESKLSSLNLKSPSAGGGSGFPGSPGAGQYLAPEDAKAKARQNRISAPGTLQPHDRWQAGQLDQVMERGSSPGLESDVSGRSRSKSPTPEPRPKSTDFSGKPRESLESLASNRDRTSYPRSPRASGAGAGVGLGIGEQSPMSSPFHNPSWASMVNTPMAGAFGEGNKLGTPSSVADLSQALNMATLQLQNPGYLPLEDPRKYRRPSGLSSGQTSRQVSSQYNDDGEVVHPRAPQPGQPQGLLPNQFGARSPLIDQFGLNSAGLGMGADHIGLGGYGGLGMGGIGGLNAAQAAQMLAMQQQLAAAQAQAQGGPYSPFSASSPALSNNLNPGRHGLAAQRPQGGQGRRSPNPMKANSPAPGQQGGGGGAGGGAGVAGPEDVDERVLEDVAGWLRVLRLHKYTTTFEKSNWRDMVQLTDQDLQDKGVSAQGARTKFLKVFHNVRSKLDIPHPPGQEEYAPGAK